MSKSLAQPPLTLDNGANDLNIVFYVSDAASGNAPRVQINYLHNGAVVYTSDHPISAFSSLTPTQKTNLRSMLQALRDEAFTLDGAT